jgi:WD40 repeat protein
MNVTITPFTTYKGHQGALYALLKIDNHNFLSGGSDRLIVKWNSENVDDGELIAKATAAVYSLCNPFDNYLLAGQSTGGIHIINIKNKTEEHLLQLHEGPVFSIVAEPLLQRIYTLGGDGNLNVLNYDFLLLKKIKISSVKIRCMIIIDQDIIAGCGDGTIAILNTTTLEITHRQQLHEEGFGINVLYHDIKRKRLLSASRDARINIYNYGWNLIDSFPAHRSAIYDVAFDEKNELFASASRDKSIKIWDAAKMDVIAKIDETNYNGHLYSVNKILWMGSTIISCSDDKTIKSWNILTS